MFGLGEKVQQSVTQMIRSHQASTLPIIYGDCQESIRVYAQVMIDPDDKFDDWTGGVVMGLCVFPHPS